LLLVAFDELAWHADLRGATGSAKRIGEEIRSRLEREGQAIDALFACDEEARDGTSLPGCVKVYLPPPGGPLGLLFRLAKGKDGRLYLDHLAFGDLYRHLTTGLATSFPLSRPHNRKRPAGGGGALLGLLQGGEICISIYVWIRGR
jgi:hypothetical protein